MLRYYIIFSLLFIGAAKSYVFYMEKNLGSLKRKLSKESSKLNLLKVEWTYLNQSSRLQKLATVYAKNWQSMLPEQLKNIDEIKKIVEGQVVDIKKPPQLIATSEVQEVIKEKKSSYKKSLENVSGKQASQKKCDKKQYQKKPKQVKKNITKERSVKIVIGSKK